ncbi:MAG: TVP38/TMEM64 family protein [Verrucomicrobiales bacterium]|nr:TVP38/TMEM64 family protein [Verrucomicrobiales bacterium]
MTSDSGATQPPEPPRRAAPGWVGHVIAGVLLLMVAAGVGREVGHRIPALESWIEQQGIWGWLVFVGVTLVCTSCFVPDTLFAVMAGVLYGVAGGTAIITVAVLLTAVLNFTLARWWLHGMVRRWLSRRPRLAAIERAVDREGLRFLVLLRLTPLSPVAVSYLLGTTRTRFIPFLASSLGLIPGLFVEVYLGHVARHVVGAAGAVPGHSHAHAALTLMGLALCFALLAYVTRIARRAIAEAEAEASADVGPSPDETR